MSSKLQKLGFGVGVWRDSRLHYSYKVIETEYKKNDMVANARTFPAILD